MQILVIAALTAAGVVLAFSGGDARKLEKVPSWAVFAFVLVLLLLLSRVGLTWVAIGVGAGIALGRRLVPIFRAQSSAKVPRATPARMTRQEALGVLGLQEGATRQQIADEYRRLMKRVHPDQGGSEYLATRLNEAKAVLLDEP